MKSLFLAFVAFLFSSVSLAESEKPVHAKAFPAIGLRPEVQSPKKDGYQDLGKVPYLSCTSDSGRTAVYVAKIGDFFEITAIQDKTVLLLDHVKTNLRVQESFPATYNYLGRTTQKNYLSLSQTTQDFTHFGPVQGEIRYEKQGVSYNVPITCDRNSCQ